MPLHTDPSLLCRDFYSILLNEEHATPFPVSRHQYKNQLRLADISTKPHQPIEDNTSAR